MSNKAYIPEVSAAAAPMKKVVARNSFVALMAELPTKARLRR